MPELVIIRGVPGTGKTTLARQVYVPMGYVHLEADMFFEHDGRYEWDRAKIAQAHNWCKAQAAEAMQAGRNVVVSNTFTQHWQYKPYLNLAHAYGYKVKIISLTYEYGSIHNIPDSEMNRIRSIWEE